MNKSEEKTTKTDIPTIEEMRVEKGNFSIVNLPEDAYECKIIDITDQSRMSWFKKKEEFGALFTFEIIDGPYKGKTFINFFTNKLTKRSKLTVLCRGVW